MKTQHLFSALIAAFAAPALIAGEAVATDAKPAVAKYELKARSTCNLPPGTRPPFWPIGWVHRAGPHQEAPVGPKFVLDEKNFAVTSILMGSPAIAVINGRAYEEGQFLRVKVAAPAIGAAGTPAPRIRVQRITDGQVWLAFDTEIIGVALKRPELNERKAEQEVLNEDKEDVTLVPTVQAAPSAPTVSSR